MQGGTSHAKGRAGMPISNSNLLILELQHHTYLRVESIWRYLFFVLTRRLRNNLQESGSRCGVLVRSQRDRGAIISCLNLLCRVAM